MSQSCRLSPPPWLQSSPRLFLFFHGRRPFLSFLPFAIATTILKFICQSRPKLRIHLCLNLQAHSFRNCQSGTIGLQSISIKLKVLESVIMISDQTKIDILNWDGSLSSSDFYAAAFAFAGQWKKFNCAYPEWSWVHCSNGCKITKKNVEGYLALQNVFLPMSYKEQDEGNNQGNGKPSFSDTDEPIDSATLVPSSDQNMHHYDFHIVNSPSYRVPVLYFHASNSGGQPLTLVDIEKGLPPDSAKILMESKWTFITQVEHPYLNRPWFTLHPCGTSEWMKLLLSTSDSAVRGRVPVEQYLISWFSVVGQVFGFGTPLEMLGSLDSSC